MATKIYTISLPIDLAEYLDSKPELSPSKIIQAKIIEIRENEKLYSQEMFKLQTNIKKFQDLINKHFQFLETKGIDADEFIQFSHS